MAAGRGRRGRRAGALAVVLAVAALAGACSGSGYQYVTNRSAGTYFKIPDDWELFEVTVEDRPEAVAPDRPWQVVFDASPDPSLEHLGELGDHPVGFAKIVTYTSESDRSTVSLSTLRGLAINGQGDPLALIADGNDSIELVDYQDVVTDDGYHGNRIVLNVKTTGGDFATVAQIAMLDPATTKLYQLQVACLSSCFDRYRTEIDRLLDSWTIDPKD
jgi:hypothetical protein